MPDTTPDCTAEVSEDFAYEAAENDPGLPASFGQAGAGSENPAPRFVTFASAALAGAEPEVQLHCTLLDPALLLLLARLVAQVFLFCTESKLLARLERMRQYPNGLLSLRLKRLLADRLIAEVRAHNPALEYSGEQSCCKLTATCLQYAMDHTALVRALFTTP